MSHDRTVADDTHDQANSSRWKGRGPSSVMFAWVAKCLKLALGLSTCCKPKSRRYSMNMPRQLRTGDTSDQGNSQSAEK